MEINSMDEFYHQLAAAKDRLTVVYFYYSYCGSCLQVLPKWKEVVRSHAGISFLKVEVKDVVKSGAGLAFIAYPDLVRRFSEVVRDNLHYFINLFYKVTVVNCLL